MGADGPASLLNTAPGIPSPLAKDTVMFINLPSVVSTHPTNGLFDAQTDITVIFQIIGRDEYSVFKNISQSLPCRFIITGAGVQFL